ncbi:MAG: (2Fe-2S) ferredoxin domain-containing protein [Leptolyngbyaceae cyanobacterium SL_7_1]|nr:(2Fe-2S) ferredoxin domain-containing protein [Leptolyngbyaceae cyanobacterium SL_7_1]
MGRTTIDQPFSFVIEGKFAGFILEDGYKIKRLRLSTATGEQIIKLSKEARTSLGRMLALGEWIRVEGYQKRCEKKGYLKVKAYRIQVISEHPVSDSLAITGDRISSLNLAESIVTKPAKQRATILVCQKSDCCKRGGHAVAEALQSTLEEYELTDRVVIKGTGCMKQCKAGPNIVMPDKTHHTRVTPQLACDLVGTYFHQQSERSVFHSSVV